MPVLDQKTLAVDLDGLNLLTAVLHPTKQARSEAMRRGQELAKAFASAQRLNAQRAGRHVTDTPAG